MRNSVAIAVLSAFVIGSYFLLRSMQKEFADAAVTDEKTVLATAYNVDVRYFDEKDKLQYSFTSPEITEYSHDYGMYFRSPEVLVVDKEAVPVWSGHANNAMLSQNKKKLTLKGDVHITQSPSSKAAMHIQGAEAYYDATTKMIISNSPVKINDGSIEQTSASLRLNTISRQLEAQKHVKVSYQTAKKP